MSGHLDLGNHRNMQRIGVGHHFADLLLGVETSVGIRILPAAIGTSGIEPLQPRLDRTPGSDLRQLGITVDLDTPAGTVGQMPMQAVEFERGHHPQLFFHKLLAEEVARLVEMHAPVFETRSIDNALGGNPVAETAAELQQRLQSIEEARLAARLDDCSLGKNRELISLLRCRQPLFRGDDKSQGGIRSRLRCGQGGRFQISLQRGGHLLRCIERYGKGRRNLESPCTFFDRGGSGNDYLDTFGRVVTGYGRKRQAEAGSSGDQESEQCFLHVLLGKRFYCCFISFHRDR